MLNIYESFLTLIKNAIVAICSKRICKVCYVSGVKIKSFKSSFNYCFILLLFVEL